MRYLLTGFIFVLLLIGSCNRHSAEWSTLLSVEEWIIDDPDSAMDVLDAIDTTSLCGEEERALYGLLMTMAQEKTNIVVADDSLIRLAARYFEDKGDQRREMIANCYLGMVRYDLERHSEAIVNYYKAKEIAEKVGDWFYAGLACRGLSDIYNATLNKEEEVRYADRELNNFRRSGRQPYVNYALLDYARAHYNSNNFDLSLETIEELIDSAIMADDEYLHFAAIQLKSICYVTQGKFMEALPILREVTESSYSEAEDSLRLCWTLLRLNRNEEVKTLENKMQDSILPWNSFIKYRMYKYQGQYDLALAELERVDSLSEEYIHKSISNNINGGLVNYVETKNVISQSQLNEARTKFWFITTVLIISILLLSIWIRKKIKQWRKERDAKVNFVEELQENLTESERKCEELSGSLNKEKEIQKSLITQLDEERLKMKELFLSLTENKSSYDKLSQEFEVEKTARKILVDDLEEERNQRQLLIEHMAKEKEEAEHRKEIIKTLFAGQYQYLEGIISAIQESKDSTTAKKKIANSMTGLVDELSYQSKTVNELEKKVDTVYKSLISDFRNDLPKLKEIDYRLYLYSVMGFSIPSISLLLKVDKIEDVYNRKRHLKDKIKRLDSQKAERYLLYLS